MSLTRILIIVAAFTCTSLASAQSEMTSDQAFQAGQAFGSSANSGIAPNINSGKAAEVLKDYTPTAPESSYWQGNNTLLSNVLSGGSDKIYDCDANVGSMTDPKQKNPCEAINMLNKLPAVMPPPMVTKTDPLYTTGRAIADNPEAIAGAIKGAYSGCTTKTTTIQGETVNQTCDEYLGIDNVKCQIGQVVEVDADHLYKCLETLKALSDQTCTIGRVVELNPEYNYQCIQNQYQTKTMKCEKVLTVTATQKLDGDHLGTFIIRNVVGEWFMITVDYKTDSTYSMLIESYDPNTQQPMRFLSFYDDKPNCKKLPSPLIDIPVTYGGTVPLTIVFEVLMFSESNPGYCGQVNEFFYFSQICDDVSCILTVSATSNPGLYDSSLQVWASKVISLKVVENDIWDNQCLALEARAN